MPIKFTISKTGDISAEGHGIVGPSCQDMLGRLSAHMGLTPSDPPKLTDEFYAAESGGMSEEAH